METWVDMIHNEPFATWGSNYPTEIRKMRKAIEDFPNDVTIMFDETDEIEGSLEIRIPKKWFKSPKQPKQVSDKLKKEASERFKKMWEDKNNG